MMPAALWWRLVLVWLCVLVLVSRHPSCYVGCTEELQEATSLPAQDIVSEEEQGENTPMAEESWVSHVHSLSEDELMTAGQRPDEDLDTQALAVEDEDEDVEQGPKAMSAEEPAAEVKLETETDDDAAAAGEPEPDTQLPDTPPPTITQDQQPAVSSEPSPASPGATAVTPDDATSDSAEASSISASQDQTLSSGSDNVESDMPPPEPSDEHLATTDCEAGEANPYDDASPPVVLENTSNAHIAGTKTHTDPAMSPPPARSTDSQGGNTSHMLKEKGLSPPVAAETDSSTGSKDPEDNPTFDEWKRKVMEVENEKTQATHTSSNGASVPVKKVQKNFNNNYASVECGAKILGSNPEAKSTSAILMENMDMYMLNPCSNKIWFIIELCEPIQLKQFDIANFELFSSTPKDFLVSISDRYPTNKWLKLGTFHGRDERTVQSFPLDEHLYAKYVKVELLSHFGSEHFCPLSLIRVFGTSMVEEYEEIADPSERAEDPDDDLDYPPGYVLGENLSSKNLIGSAKDAILNMVNSAVNVLGGSSEMQGNASFQVNMTEPPLQTDANTEAAGAATTIAPLPDAEEAEILLDSDFPATEAPPPDLPTPELPIAESTELELPPVEDSIVTPLPADEDESISCTITLLGEEEDEDEESKEEREAKEKRQHESSDCCGPLSFSSQPSSSTFCSCSSSLQEYLMHQCFTRLSKQRKLPIPESKATITHHPYLPVLTLPVSPPASQVTQWPHTEINQPQVKELDPGSAETAASPSEVPLIPGNATEPQTGSVSEPSVLEPSQTSSIPKPSATESPTAKSTLSPAAQLPQHSSKGLPKELRPDRSQDEQAAESQGGTTVSPSVSVPDRTSGSATVEHVSVPPTDDKPKMDFGQSGQDPPSQETESAVPAHTLQPSTSSEQQPVPPATPENASPPPEELLPAPPIASELDPSEGLSATATESKVVDDLMEDMIFTSTNDQLTRPSSTSPPSSSFSPTHSEFYAELHNMTEHGNGNQVHGSSLKESVFMRLNNRIKALEMNMSLSGRYLEQLSQRYRKQMEEMQKAFNQTIIKLQNTARMAEEQDLRQTESIQFLQGQLENITQLVLNLSVRVSQLQSDVSDRQSYLLASLTLCLFLGLILCANRCGASADIEPPTLLAEPEPPEEPGSYSNCERQFASCDDTWLKRRASYPLLHSDSMQIPTTEGPESLPTVETQRFSPANRKKRRAKVKPREGVETRKASLPTPELANGFTVCNGLPHAANPAHRLLHPAFKDSPSEGSSEGSSSHSDDTSFCGITTIATACTRLCDGLPLPRTKAEKRALRRRRPKPGPSVVNLLQAQRRDKIDYMPVPSTMQDLGSRSNELSSGTFVVNAALSGPA